MVFRFNIFDPYLDKEEKELAHVKKVKQTFKIFVSLSFELDQLDGEEQKLSYRAQD